MPALSVAKEHAARAADDGGADRHKQADDERGAAQGDRQEGDVKGGGREKGLLAKTGRKGERITGKDLPFISCASLARRLYWGVAAIHVAATGGRRRGIALGGPAVVRHRRISPSAIHTHRFATF